jgi:hypothetical protein
VKCNTCAHAKHGRCSFEETPEERLDHAEAAFVSGQDSLTCKFSILSFISSSLTYSLYIFLDLRLLLDQMNDFRNMGNANAALATLNYNHHDRLADEFIHRLFRLAGEDVPEALVDNYFNEDRVMEVLDEILEDLPLFDNDLPRPGGMYDHFERLARAVHSVKVEDATAQVLVQQLQQENANRLRRRSPSPPIAIDGDADDFYVDADSDDIPLDAARNDPPAGADELDPDDLPKHPDDLIDDEAVEVPEGEESSPSPSEEDEPGSPSADSEASSTEESEDASEGSGEEEEDEGDAPPSPPITALVEYGSD